MESQIENFGRADGQPLVSLVVLNCNGAGWLPKCFETIKAQTILGQIEAIMVDNNSTDDSVAVARRLLADFPCARIVRNSANLGFCEGNNSGARGERTLLVLPEQRHLDGNGLHGAVDCGHRKTRCGRRHAVCIELPG